MVYRPDRQRTSGPSAGVSVVEGPIDLGRGWRCVAAVGVGDLPQDVVDVCRGWDLAIDIGEGDDQLSGGSGGIERGDPRAVLDQITTAERDAVSVAEREDIFGVGAAVADQGDTRTVV